MNRLTESTLPPGKPAAHRDRNPWWRTPIESPSEIGSSLDPTAARAYWRLIHIGEISGLLTAGDSQIIASGSLTSRGRFSEIMLQELRRLKFTLTEFYALVTLFAAAPRPVTVPILVRESLSEPDTLRKALDRLSEAGAIGCETLPSGETGLQLTSSGSRLAVLLIYRVIAATT